MQVWVVGVGGTREKLARVMDVALVAGRDTYEADASTFAALGPLVDPRGVAHIRVGVDHVICPAAKMCRAIPPVQATLYGRRREGERSECALCMCTVYVL